MCHGGALLRAGKPVMSATPFEGALLIKPPPLAVVSDFVSLPENHNGINLLIAI